MSGKDRRRHQPSCQVLFMNTPHTGGACANLLSMLLHDYFYNNDQGRMLDHMLNYALARLHHLNPACMKPPCPTSALSPALLEFQQLPCWSNIHALTSIAWIPETALLVLLSLEMCAGVAPPLNCMCRPGRSCSSFIKCFLPHPQMERGQKSYRGSKVGPVGEYCKW